MSDDANKYRADLQRLIKLSDHMFFDIAADHLPTPRGKTETEQRAALQKRVRGMFHNRYHRWYTEAVSVIEQIIPHRHGEFVALYEADPRRKFLNVQTFAIQDWMLSIRATEDYRGEKQFDDQSAVISRFQVQIEILRSAEARFDSSLLDIRRMVQADLLDSELAAATELRKHGFVRAGGVVAGVVLERHLKEVCESHNLKTRKKKPTISDFNDLLKKGTAIDTPMWRMIQRLGDLRNLAAHDDERDPTADEIDELIAGVAKVTKTVF